MFEGFARVWTPVALSARLQKKAPMGVKVAGEGLVLFRDKEGRARAMLDRCPHRGVALSLGRMREGCLECPFHGWRFGGDGEVCHVPWNPDAKLPMLRGTTVPTRELGGQIWIYTAPVETPPDEPQVHESLERPGVRVSGSDIECNTHWTRAMENMLDWPHLPFVHRKTIGKNLVERAGQRMDIEMDERPWGLHTRIKIDGKDEPGSLDFRWPNQMNLHIPAPGKLLMMMVACVPIDATRTRMMMTMARDFMTSPFLDAIFNRTNRKIAMEDLAIIESSVPAEIPPAGEERSVRTDAPTLFFRKRYLTELKGSAA